MLETRRGLMYGLKPVPFKRRPHLDFKKGLQRALKAKRSWTNVMARSDMRQGTAKAR